MAWYDGMMNMFKFNKSDAGETNYKYDIFDKLSNTEEYDSWSAVSKYFSGLDNNQNTLNGAGMMTDKGVGDFLYGSVSTNKIVRLASYRRMVSFPEVGDAIDEICDSSITNNEIGDQVTLKIASKYDAIAQKEIELAWTEFLNLFDFENQMFDYMRTFCIDGELSWENIISKDKPEAGILKIKFIPCESYEFAYNIKTKEKVGLTVFSDSTDIQDDTNGTKNVGGVDISNLNSYETITQNKAVFLPFEQVTYINTGLYNSLGTYVYPVLERARRAYNQLSMIEDAIIIYRLVRAPERLVFNVDVGNASRSKGEQEVMKMMKKYNTKKVYNPATGTIANDYDVHSTIECLALDTKIPLLDGRTISLQEIISEYEKNPEKTLWTLSCSPTTGQVKPGKISWAGITRKDAAVMRLTFDNGKSITCTPDHKFPLWGKGGVEAKDIQLNDSVISYSVKDEKVYDGELKEWKNVNELCEGLNIDCNIEENKNEIISKISKIEFLDEKQDTGTLTIDKEEEIHEFHTFATDAGVFTYNSFWFAKSAAGGGTDVESLASGANLGELEDLHYFLRKLYLSLKVPYNRYEEPTNQLERSESINYEEYRFAKFIMRLHTRFALGIKNSFKTHLKLKGIWASQNIKEVDLKIKFTPPSSFDIYEEQQRLSIKIDQYSTIADRDEFSNTLAMKNYLGWSEEMILENWKRLEQDAVKQGIISFKQEQAESTGSATPLLKEPDEDW